MEKDFYHSDDFEELIREKADQYKMYPSEKVWKSIDRALRTHKRWYWTGFVLLLSGVSYFAVTELMSPITPAPIAKEPKNTPVKQVTAAQLNPFTSSIEKIETPEGSGKDGKVITDLHVEDSGSLTAAFEIPLQFLPGNETASPKEKAAFRISGLLPLADNESYNIELSWPVETVPVPVSNESIAKEEPPVKYPQSQETDETMRINWFEEKAFIKLPEVKPNRISWQLAFSPTVNYRKLTGSSNSRTLAITPSVPLASRVDGDIDKLVNHKPALGFEVGTHGLFRLSESFALKGGVQFNYSKYDIRAFRTPKELATIALNSQVGTTGGAIVNYTDLRNFGGTSVEDLKNQYFQLSMPVGFELRVFGNDNLQFNVASTIQPTYLINRNTYLITTDLKNYTKAPSLVRRWNVNAGAEAYVSYSRGDVKWQVGPQFRYQLLSSYQKVYPIKEYLMEYGIKVGITKTIR